MTHTGHIATEEGDFQPWQRSAGPCPHCGGQEHFYRLWESNDGAYEDYEHRCESCKRTWWVEGIDS